MARTGQRELTPDDLRDRVPPPVDLTHGASGRVVDEIELVDRPLNMEYADALKFNEDILTVRIEQSQDDEIPVAYYPFSVNGKTIGLVPGKETKVARKYVEVVLRASQFRVHTHSPRPGDRDERNLVFRHPTKRFMISIIHDPDPRGREWAQRIGLES